MTLAPANLPVFAQAFPSVIPARESASSLAFALAFLSVIPARESACIVPMRN
jgi:hypothetical protein